MNNTGVLIKENNTGMSPSADGRITILAAAPQPVLSPVRAVPTTAARRFTVCGSRTAASEWMLLYCLEWAGLPVGTGTVPDCGPAVKEHTNENSSARLSLSLSSQASAEHFNGDQWKGRDRRSRG